MRYLRIKYNEKIRQKAQSFNIKYDNITQMRETKITLISSSSCDLYINCRINFRNFKINLSTIKIKIKYFRANEITHST